MAAAMTQSIDSCSESEGEDEPQLGRLHQQSRMAKFCQGIRRVKSNGALVTLLLELLTYGAFCSAFKMSTELTGYFKDIQTIQTQLLAGIIGFTVFTAVCPLFGWLADVYLTRYRVIQAGLWLMWIGSIVEAVNLILLSQYSSASAFKELNIVGTIFGFIVVPVGFAAVAVNIMQFGTDQMPEASADETSAFIHWFTWAAFLGFVIASLTQLINYCVKFDGSYASASVQAVVPTAMLSFAICCTFVFRGWLTIEPEHHNPLRTVFGVLKFAALHKSPVRHCAITYCDRKRPSRIDFAKSDYGGPYTSEQVEDVKTFFRIIVVATSTALFSMPILLYLISQTFISFHGDIGRTYNAMKRNIGKSCREEAKWFGYSFATLTVIIIPLYEMVIHPLVRNRVPRTLRRVILSAALTVFMSGSVLIVDSIEHELNPTLYCMFNNSENVLNPYSYKLDIPLNFLVAVQLVLYVTAILEFASAQSPYSMRGLLIGLMYSLAFLTFPIAYGIFVIWDRVWKKLPSHPSCDFYYFLFQFLCAVVGLVAMCLVTRWYKRRVREDPWSHQALVESTCSRS